MRNVLSVMQLGTFDFDSESGMLTRSGKRVPLPPKSLATLSILVDRLGELVTKSELITRLWPEGFVSDQNLTQHIYNLRRAFADDASISIETIPRRGFRLSVNERPALVATPGLSPLRIQRRPAWTIAGIAFTLTFVLMVAIVVRGVEHGAALPPPAARHYLLAEHFWSARSLTDLDYAKREFDEARRLAPGDARPYGGLALVTAARVELETARFTATDIAVASFYAREALAIDGGLSDAHAALGRLAFYRGDHLTARAEFERALAADRRNSAAHEWFALEYLISGDLPRALPQFEAAADVDPGSERVARWLALGYYCAGRFDDARIELEHAIELEPANDDARIMLALTQTHLGLGRRALQTIRPAMRGSTRAMAIAVEAYVHAHFGERNLARALAGRALHMARSSDAYTRMVSQLAAGSLVAGRRTFAAAFSTSKDTEMRAMLLYDYVLAPLRSTQT